LETSLSLACPDVLGKSMNLFPFFFFFFLVGLGFELRASHRHVRLKPPLWSILLWLFQTWGLINYLPGLSSNSDPPK
jgi:hypothetical protein